MNTTRLSRAYKAFFMKSIIILGIMQFFFLIPSGSIFSDSDFKAKPRWISSKDMVQPGEEFSIGLYFRIKKDWHIYWRNGGEVGLPVEFKKWKVENVKLMDLRWPAPEIHRDETKLTSYIYKNETLLRFSAKAANNSEPGSFVKISALITWLECKESCIPRESLEKISIPIGKGSSITEEKINSKASNLFKRFNQQYPKTFDNRNTNHSFKIIRWGWDKKPLRSTEEESKILYNFTVEALVKNSSDDAWPGCRIFPYEVNNKGKLSFLAGEKIWEFGLGKIASSGQTGKGRVLRFSISARIPNTFSSAPWLELHCPGIQEQPLDIRIPLTKYNIIQPVAKDQSNLLTAKHDSQKTASLNEVSLLSFIWVIFAAFLGGLILNIMPCVLPVISIKIFSLLKQAGEDKNQIFRHGIIFSAGIVASFIMLALVILLVKSLGMAVGWGFQFQSPYFLIFLSMVLLVFGLSFFNVYSFNVPNISGIRTISTGKGELSSFFQGVLATLLATPCSAPFLGTAMGFAFSQSFAIIIVIFISAGIGMAFPYIILAFYPKGIKFLPKPGAWMEKFKQLMGFFLLATLIWIIWILSRMISSDGVIDLLIFLLLISLALWFGGSFAPLGSTRKRFFSIWSISLLFIIASAVHLLPSMITFKGKGISRNQDTIINGVTWKPYSKITLKKARESNQPIFLKFTADWCLTCKVNEKTVLSAESVIKSFKKNRVITISADWTRGDKQITKLLSSFGRSGVPFYVIYPPDKNKPAIPLSEIITPNTIIEHLEKL